MTRLLLSVVSFLTALVFIFGAGLAGYTYWKSLSPWYYGVCALCLLCFLFGLMDVIMLRRKISIKAQAKNKQKIEEEAEKLAARRESEKAAAPETAPAASGSESFGAEPSSPAFAPAGTAVPDAGAGAAPLSSPPDSPSACAQAVSEPLPEVALPGEAAAAGQAASDGEPGGFLGKLKSVFKA